MEGARSVLKKVVLSVFIGFIVFVLGVGYGFVNLKSNSVYYAQRTPHKAGMEPVLMEVARDLWWTSIPGLKGIEYDFDGYRNIYNKKYGKDEAASFAYYFREEYLYDDGNFFLYTFDKRFRLISPELHMFVVFGGVFGLFVLVVGFWFVFLGH